VDLLKCPHTRPTTPTYYSYSYIRRTHWAHIRADGCIFGLFLCSPRPPDRIYLGGHSAACGRSAACARAGAFSNSFCVAPDRLIGYTLAAAPRPAAAGLLVGPLGPSVSIWAHEPHRPIWASRAHGPHGPIWATWVHMGPLGPWATWPHMGPWATWAHMGPHGPSWATWVHMGPLGHMGREWVHMGLRYV
jgi:hypothetical protein